MKIEQLCVSLETANKLEESGFPLHNTYFVWVRSINSLDKAPRILPRFIVEEDDDWNILAVAPTLEEIEDVTPNYQKVSCEKAAEVFLKLKEIKP